MTTEDLLTRVARGHDRNVAPFLAGRDAEMESFEGAIEDAKHEAQTGTAVDGSKTTPCWRIPGSRLGLSGRFKDVR